MSVTPDSTAHIYAMDNDITAVDSEGNPILSASLTGDVNLDDNVSLLDVLAINKYLAGSVTFNDQQMANAECVADGTVNSNDAGALLGYVVERYTSLPVIPAGSEEEEEPVATTTVTSLDTAATSVSETTTTMTVTEAIATSTSLASAE
jgi:hypothetical protein